MTWQLRFSKVSEKDEYPRYLFEAIDVVPGKERMECEFTTGTVEKNWDRVYGDHWIAYRSLEEDRKIVGQGKTRQEAAMGAVRHWCPPPIDPVLAAAMADVEL